jgi:hypothetical protein
MITTFDIVGGADAERFTLKKGNKLTFKATAFKARNNFEYICITLVSDKRDYLVCVFRRRNISSRGNTKRPIVIRIFGYGYSKGFVSRERFTLKKGNKLTFKATAFKARNNTYRVNIRVLQRRFDRGFEGNLPETAYKTLTVTVTKNPDDDGALRITTAADVSTPENTDKVITLITNKSDTNVFKNMLTIFTIVDGADAKRFTLAGNKLTVGTYFPLSSGFLVTVTIRVL